jgi:hypothetical protein
MAVSELINLRPGMVELQASMQLMYGGFQVFHLAVEGTDLALGRLLTVLLLDDLMLLGALVEDVIRNIP